MEKYLEGSQFSEVELSEFDFEIIKAVINEQEYEKDQTSKYLAGITLLVLMLTQISSLWTKFIIGAAYNYSGKHDGVPKYDI